MINVYWIDLFCGAGGTSTGIHMANVKAKVIACVNHDAIAIESHRENHPDCHHFTEDIRDFSVVLKLKKIVDELRKNEPECIINIWASLECTNYSKAKGGLPRDADSRTLAEHLFMYIDELNPDYLYIENVREFMAWGPLDSKGKPLSRDKGKDYIRWIQNIEKRGFDYGYRLLNSADYGAYTSRERYFGQFAKKGLPISWPIATHSKKPEMDPGLFEKPKTKWKAVKDVLDLKDEGESIFTRKKPLSENTLKRIYAGLEKFVANGDATFTKQYNSGSDSSRVKSIEEPVGVLTTSNSHAVVKSVFIKKYFSGRPEGKVISVNGPAGTIKCVDGQAIVQSTFLSPYYGKSNPQSVEGPCNTLTTKDRFSKVDTQFLLDYQYKSNAHSLENPCPTIVTKDKFAKVETQFLVNNYSNGGEHTDINNPAPTITNVPKSNLASCQFIDQQYGQSKPHSIEENANTITANPKFNLVSAKPWLMDTNFSNVGSSVDEPAITSVAARKHHYLMNPQYRSNGSSIDNPCFTLIARMDKAPPYLIETESGDLSIVVFENDSEMTVKIKEFMAFFGIIDIKMRMLKVSELLRIQGFPKKYKLKGSKTNQKKFIGNSVVPRMAKCLVESNYESIVEYLNAA